MTESCIITGAHLSLKDKEQWEDDNCVVDACRCRLPRDEGTVEWRTEDGRRVTSLTTVPKARSRNGC